MDPQQRSVAEEFDSYKQSYKDAVNASLGFSGLDVDFFTRVKAEYLIDLLARHVGALDRLHLLDIGCGIGNYHRLLQPYVGGLTGVDVATECVAQAASENPGVSYDSYDGSNLPYEAGRFDAAFTICVMHHVPRAHWPKFVSEAYRVLRPGGLFVVFEHNPLNPLTRRVVDRCPFDRDAELLKAPETVDLLREARFMNVEQRFILSIPAANRLLRGVDQLFGALPLGAQYYVIGTKPPDLEQTGQPDQRDAAHGPMV
ncbi:MAG: methyltransferase domain-containing protein [Rhizobiaceae bacterium]